MEVVRVIEVVCDKCTEQQARDYPWKYARNNKETDIDLRGFEVESVESNE